MKTALQGLQRAITFSLPRHQVRCSYVAAARAAGGRTDIAFSRLRTLLHAALSGVNKISPLRGERFSHNFQKYGAIIPLLMKKGCA